MIDNQPIASSTKTPRFIQESGQFLVSRWGSNLALGFKGDKSFIERSHAWAINTGLSQGELKWVYGVGGKIAYVTVKSREKIKKAVTMQIRADIISDKEVPLLPDEIDPKTGSTSIVFNDPVIDSLAAERAERFMEKIEDQPFLEDRHTGLAPVYAFVDEPWTGFKRNRNK